MELLEKMQLIDALHGASSDLLIPTVVILIALVLFSLYSIGSIAVEFAFDRRNFKAHIPQLIAHINDASMPDVARVISNSALLPDQKVDLLDFLGYLHLPPKALIEVAKRLVAKQEKHYNDKILITTVAAKIAPMLGLMGTLIPLGPGLMALGSGDVSTLSQSLIVAFDTTVVGLAAAAICFVISILRRRWYEEYVASIESIACALLEKAELAEEATGVEDAHAADEVEGDCNGR